MRLIVRRIVLAVALTLTLLPLAVGILWLLSPQQIRLRALTDSYEAKASHHAELEREFARLSEYSDKSHMIAIRGGQRVHMPLGQRLEQVPKYLELAKHHGALRKKYENAAWHPTLPVEPDPPSPEP
jgi:hypothetical protein